MFRFHLAFCAGAGDDDGDGDQVRSFPRRASGLRSRPRASTFSWSNIPDRLLRLSPRGRPLAAPSCAEADAAASARCSRFTRPGGTGGSRGFSLGCVGEKLRTSPLAFAGIGIAPPREMGGIAVTGTDSGGRADGKIVRGDERRAAEGMTGSRSCPWPCGWPTPIWGGHPGAGNGYSKRGEGSKGVPTMEEGEWRTIVPSSRRGFRMGCGGVRSSESLEERQHVLRGLGLRRKTYLRDRVPDVRGDENEIICVWVRGGSGDALVGGEEVRVGERNRDEWIDGDAGGGNGGHRRRVCESGDLMNALGGRPRLVGTGRSQRRDRCGRCLGRRGRAETLGAGVAGEEMDGGRRPESEARRAAAPFRDMSPGDRRHGRLT